MARSFLKVFFDFEERTEALSDTERGRLLLCMLRYAETGETPALSGNERVIWPVFKAEIDKEIAVYNTRVDNGNRGGRPGKNGTEQNRNKPNETETKRNKPNNNQTETETNPNAQEQEQEQEQDNNIDDDDDIRARMNEEPDSIIRFAIESSYRASFGRMPTPSEEAQLTAAVIRMKISAGLISMACEKAAIHGARAPVKYLLAVFDEWRQEDIRTVEEAERHQMLFDTAAGKDTYFSTNDIHSVMEREREARKSRHSREASG